MRFSEEYRDFAEESIREGEYKGFKYRVTDPYGMWVVEGIQGSFTNVDWAEKAINEHIAKGFKPDAHDTPPVEIKPIKKTTKKVS